MKLKNKKTGEIAEGIVTIDEIYVNNQDGLLETYSSLAELCEEWEDYEEPKEYWVILNNGGISCTDENDEYLGGCKEIGNYFESKEEAEKAVEKLKAWKRLKDKGFKFESAEDFMHSPLDEIHFEYDVEHQEDVYKDICIIVGGEE